MATKHEAEWYYYQAKLVEIRSNPSMSSVYYNGQWRPRADAIAQIIADAAKVGIMINDRALT